MKIIDILDKPKNSRVERAIKNLNGNFVFFDRGDSDELYDDVFPFYCGPQEQDGCLSDAVFCNKWLSNALKNIKCEIEIGASENNHLICKPNLTEDEVDSFMLDIKRAIKEALPSGINFVVREG